MKRDERGRFVSEKKAIGKEELLMALDENIKNMDAAKEKLANASKQVCKSLEQIQFYICELEHANKFLRAWSMVTTGLLIGIGICYLINMI